MPSLKHLLLIDAYDSFSENIAALLQHLIAVKVTVIRVDSWTVSGSLDNTLSERQEPQLNSGPQNIDRHQDNGVLFRTFNLETNDYELLLEHYDAVVVGPGPGDPRNPADLGIVSRLWKAAERCGVPILGICLGFQSLCLAYGASIVPLSEPCHGHAEKILHRDKDIFAHVGEVIATNYHSLEVQVGTSQVNSISSSPGSARSSCSNISGCSEAQDCPDIEQLAWNEKGTLMAVRHTRLPFWGLQFHPESCRSNAACHNLVRNWWRAALEWSGRTRRSHHMEIFASDRLTGQADRHWPASCNGVAWATEKNKVREQDCSTPGHLGDEQALCDELRHLTQTVGGVVHSRTLQKSIHIPEIGQFCQSLCADHALAMLESTKKGRFCIYAIPSPDSFTFEYFRGKGSAGPGHSSSTQAQSYCTIQKEGAKMTCSKFTISNVLYHLEQIVLTERAKGGHRESPFWGGFIGYFSYEMGMETLNLATRGDSVRGPNADIGLLWAERSIVVDKLTDTIHVQSIRRDDFQWIATMTETLECLRPKSSVQFESCASELASMLASARLTIPDEKLYKRNIETCQFHLRAGSSYELCLTTEARIIIPSTHSTTSWLLYQNLQNHNPAPFSAYLSLGKTKVLSSSPEQFLAWDRNGSMNMIPMKGTVSKSDPGMTFAKAATILASPKESAENLMIADLIRHDMYSTVGSRDGAAVEVVKLCDIVEHETVFQLVSHIRAHPPTFKTQTEDERQRQVIKYGHKALRQCIPPGSMTGAPKKRSCEILYELEKRPRGVYSGVLGYLDVGGGGAFSVCIRTAFSHEEDDRDGMQTWRVGAGGAITVLSDIDAEWEEMRTKLDSVLRAFRVPE